MNDDDARTAIVLQSPVRHECSEAAMVLESVGIPNAVIYYERQFALVVEVQDEPKAAEQLRLYRLENQRRPKPRLHSRILSNGAMGAMLYAAILLLLFDLQNFEPTAEAVLAAGTGKAAAVQAGEWWRAVTALTLHVDLGHLAGNLGFGILMGVVLSQLLGSGLAWFAILASGILGNLINGVIQPETHHWIGASTAIFGAVGILSTYIWWRRDSWLYTGMRRWLPLLVGVTLLAFLGGPQERTDWMAHITGFVCGAALGLLIALLGRRLRLDERGQLIFGGLAIASVAGAWAVAFLT
ncbi:MAG: rhomboid family intramembrane serine protease [Pseudomonadota bacterium]